MRREKFLAYPFAGAFVWNFFLIYVGFLLGKEWQVIGQYTHPIDVIALILLGAFICWLIFKEIEKRTFLRMPRIMRRSRKFIKKSKAIFRR